MNRSHAYAHFAEFGKTLYSLRCSILAMNGFISFSKEEVGCTIYSFTWLSVGAEEWQLLSYHFIAQCICKGEISASATCHVWRFVFSCDAALAVTYLVVVTLK